MAKTMYLITYDLKFYTKPEIWDKEYKIYNSNSGYFEELEEKPIGIDINSLECDIDVIKDIMKDVIHTDCGYLIDDDKMKWYLNFEKEQKTKPHLLKNDELLFNYLVLKGTLAGIKEDVAKQIYANYIANKNNYSGDITKIEQIIFRLDEFIKQKKYWIPDISGEINKECLLLDDIIRSRSTSVDYNFEMFEERYLKTCNEGYIRKILRYNKNKNNLFSQGLSFSEQKDFLLKFFEITETKLIESIADSYEYFKGNFASKRTLIENMRRVLEYAMKFWDE